MTYEEAFDLGWEDGEREDDEIVEKNEEQTLPEDHKDWYRERAQDFEFHPFTLSCDMCLSRDAFYIGVTRIGTPFCFCKYCRDELKQLKDQKEKHNENH